MPFPYTDLQERLRGCLNCPSHFVWYLIITSIPRTKHSSLTFWAVSSLKGLPLYSGIGGVILTPFASLGNSSFKLFLLVRAIPKDLRLISRNQSAQSSRKLNQSQRWCTMSSYQCIFPQCGFVIANCSSQQLKFLKLSTFYEHDIKMASQTLARTKEHNRSA